MVYEKILELCKTRKISIASLEKQLGFGNATIRGWRTSSPSLEKIKKVADYFSVQIEDLIA